MFGKGGEWGWGGGGKGWGGGARGSGFRFLLRGFWTCDSLSAELCGSGLQGGLGV